jgi:hypothetical protein
MFFGVRKIGVAAAALLCALLVGGSAHADPVPPTPPADLHVCTLPGKAPYWFDYVDGAVPFWKLFARPGVIAAAPNLQLPAEIRARGGTTVYFDLYLNARVGKPNTPADPATIDARADRLYLYVENSTHCSNPVIAENELFGAGAPTPWSPTNAQYRANILHLFQRLAYDGAQPWLLVNSPPATAGDAAGWWRSIAGLGGIVREIYFSARTIQDMGPVLGSRMLRQNFRQSILDFSQIGVPTARLGLFLGFQTTKGTGGREGLKPARAWFETIKLQVLAVKKVVKEMRFNSIWSWGWAEYSTQPGEVDPDKPRAACVYLWVRNPHLCNGPAAAGRGFNRSLSEGQLDLPGNLRCRIDGTGSVPWSSIGPLVKLTGDPELAFSSAYARAIEQRQVPVSQGTVAAAERALVSARFGGSWTAYRAALADARATPAVAHGVIGDELRRARIESRFSVSAPSGADVAEYQQTYGDGKARLVEARSRTPWLGGRKVGYAISSTAPAALMTLASGRWSKVWSATGPVLVRALGEPVRLASIPRRRVTPSIRAALIAQARDARYPSWIATQQARSFDQAICWRDELPALGIADLTDYAPFLRLTS